MTSHLAEVLGLPFRAPFLSLRLAFLFLIDHVDDIFCTPFDSVNIQPMLDGTDRSCPYFTHIFKLETSGSTLQPAKADLGAWLTRAVPLHLSFSVIMAAIHPTVADVESWTNIQSSLSWELRGDPAIATTVAESLTRL